MSAFRLRSALTSALRPTTARSCSILPSPSAARPTTNPALQAWSAFNPTSRAFSCTPLASHGGNGRPKKGEGIILHFKLPNGEIETVEANEGDDIVDVSWEYDLDIEAACEKSIACSTCHVILEDAVYDSLEEPSDDENDMLDLAFGLTDTSRLGCQCKVTKEFHNSTITLPSATRNLRVDGSKPTHH